MDKIVSGILIGILGYQEVGKIEEKGIEVKMSLDMSLAITNISRISIDVDGSSISNHKLFPGIFCRVFRKDHVRTCIHPIYLPHDMYL